MEQSTEKSLLILGAGGFGGVVEDTARLLGYTKIAFLDDNAAGEQVIGKLESLERHLEFGEAFPALGNNAMRLSWLEKLQKAGYQIPTLIHPAAAVSTGACLDEGCIVLAKAVVQTSAKIEKGALINCGAIVDHEAVIGEGAHICLGAIVKARSYVPACHKVEAGVVVDELHPIV